MCLYICIYAYISFTQFKCLSFFPPIFFYQFSDSLTFSQNLGIFSSAPGNSFNVYTVLLKTIISLGSYPLLRHLHSFCVPPPSLKHFFVAHGAIIFYKYK